MTTVPISHEETGENPSPVTEESAPAGAMEVVPARDIFPAGYRFVPTDAELITEYLKKKINNEPIPIAEMSDVELYKHSPKTLSESYPRLGQNEWYFFTPRERKYKNGSRPNRAAGKGFWKATGADKHVYDVENNCVGYRKALVFYEGKAPSGDKTNWIMHEYRVDQQISRNKRKNADDMRLDDWVLCRIYEKVAKPERNQKEVEAEAEAVAVVNVAADQVDEVNGPSPVTEEYDTPSVDSPVDQNPTENQFQNIPEKLEQDHSFDPHMGFEDHNMILREFLEPPRVEYLPYDFGMTNLTESPFINNTDFNDFFNLDIQNNQFTSPSYFVGHPTSTSTINTFHDGSSSSAFHAAVGDLRTSTSTSAFHTTVGHPTSAFQDSSSSSAFHDGSSSSSFHAAVGHSTTSTSTSAFHGGSSSSAFHAAVGHLSTSAFHDGSSSSAFHAAVGHNLTTSTWTSAFHDTAVGHPTSAFQDGSSSSDFHAAPSTNAFADPFIMAGAFADSLIKSEDCNSDVRPPTKKPKPKPRR